MSHGRGPITEEFTFRANGRSVVVPAKIDTGADRTIIPTSIAEALEIASHDDELVDIPGGGKTRMLRCMCDVAWTIYRNQGFHSTMDVWCDPDATEPLLGSDFLALHELSVDYHHRGLVGSAPADAVPLTGGGYVINPPDGWVRRQNRERANAAKPGDVLRPHPAWRFRVPAIVKKGGNG